MRTKTSNISRGFTLSLAAIMLIASPLLAKTAEAAAGKAPLTAEMTDQEARLEYARLLRNLKRYDESLIQYQKLLAEKPNDNVVKIGIAEILHYQGKQLEASNLLKGIPSDSVDDASNLLMAEIYQVMKEYPKSETIFKSYLKKNPKDSLVKLKLAEQLSWEQRYDESTQLYRQLVAENPSDIHLRRKYALVLMWMGKENEAADELKRTLNE